MDKDTKDYVINLRVSRETYEKIKEKAHENRETVSQLLRKVIDDSSEIISDVSRELFGRGTPTDILGYHKSVLAQEAICSTCRRTIPAGETVTIGETRSSKKYVFCSSCK